MRTTNEWRNEQRKVLREGGWVDVGAEHASGPFADPDRATDAEILFHLLDDADAAEAEVGRMRAQVAEIVEAARSDVERRICQVEEAEAYLAHVAVAAGLPATATPAEVVARVGEMRGAAVAVVRCVGYDLTTARAIDRLRAALASEAGR